MTVSPITSPGPHPLLRPLLRPGILDIDAYVPGQSRIAGMENVIRLAANEGALGPNPRAIEAYRRVAGEIHRYPDGQSTALRAAIATRYGLEFDRVMCGNGSDELLTLCVRAFAGPGDEVLYSQHGFLQYPIAARAAGATPVTAPERDLTTDVDALLAAVTPRTKIVMLANPNNPTGTWIDRAELARLHAGLPGHVLLVIDAAYAEFVTESAYEPGIDLVRVYDNVVMTRTFSKIHALGGLRVGWAYCPAFVADAFQRMRDPFNLSLAAQAAGATAIADLEFEARARAHNTEWRAWTAAALRELGLGIVPGVGNFLLVRFSDADGHGAAAAFDYLKRHAILTRPVGAYGLPDYLRITIGTGDEMRALVATLAEFLRVP